MATFSAPWLISAMLEMGDRVQEVPGAGDNPRIVEYHATTTLPPDLAGEDSTSWCASFVGWCLQQAGHRGTRSAAARSYLTWGRGLTQAEAGKVGSIAVLSRPPNPASGHVGFYVGTRKSRVYLCGGNQANAVTIESFAAERVLSYRWPEGVA